MNLLDHALAQESWRAFVFLAIPGAVYVALVAALVYVGTRRSGSARPWPMLFAVSATVLLYSVAVTVFEAVALYARSDPPGSGLERQGSSAESFRLLAHLAFVALATGVLTVGAALGRFATGSWRGGGVVAAATAGFMLVSLPQVEFLNSCFVGAPIVLDRISC